MADFVIHAASPLPARACFDQLVDWDAHSAAIPFTRLQYDGERRVGQRFVARTGWGPIGFDDVMVVDALQPPKGDQPGDEPGAVAISKHGRDVGGTVGWTVTPTATGSESPGRSTLSSAGSPAGSTRSSVRSGGVRTDWGCSGS
jgi:hypothetical protein